MVVVTCSANDVLYESLIMLMQIYHSHSVYIGISSCRYSSRLTIVAVFFMLFVWFKVFLKLYIANDTQAAVSYSYIRCARDRTADTNWQNSD